MTNPGRRVIRWDPYEEPSEDCLEFRLTYEGLLLGANVRKTRADHKHDIRRAFHPQLKKLWSEHRGLKSLSAPTYAAASTDPTFLEQLADLNARFGYRFAPLVRARYELLCSIEVLFLRPGARGGLLQGGDIDNRLKTLFDALSLPVDGSGLNPPEAGEDPFFCLLEDDKLITHVAVETDTLLEPIGPSENDNDARLVLTVRLRPYHSTIFSSSIFG